EYASGARERGLEVLIAGAGGAAHLPGMTAAKTILPVLGVPVQSKSLGGLDSLLSIVQMPAGVPVATFAGGAVGATNAPLGAAADRALLGRLARRCEVLTFDWENVSVASLRAVARLHGARICPPIAALAAGQDRVAEKRLFERLAIPTTRWRAVSSRAQLTRAIAAIGLPGVLKTRRLGYDGKGQAVIRTAADARRAWSALGAAPLLYEEWIPFDCEAS